MDEIDYFTKALGHRVDDLAATNDPNVVRTVIEEAEEDAERLRPPIYTVDKLIYRVTVTVLGVSVLAVIGAQLWLALVKTNQDIPDGIIAIGAAAIGALAGLLAPTPAR